MAVPAQEDVATGKRQRRLPELAIPARATYVADRRHRRVPVELQRPLWVVRQVRRRHLVAPLYVDEQRWAPRCGDVEAHVLRPRRELHRAGVVGEPRRRELGRRRSGRSPAARTKGIKPVSSKIGRAHV